MTKNGNTSKVQSSARILIVIQSNVNILKHLTLNTLKNFFKNYVKYILLIYKRVYLYLPAYQLLIEVSENSHHQSAN